jgi:hypothetical protein
VVLSGGAAAQNLAHSNETDHTSEAKTFAFVREALGRGDAETAKVMQWSDGRWWHFETIHATDLPS